MKSPASFIAITSEGGLLPGDFLHELPSPKTTIEGVTPVAYHLAEGERLSEQINRSWNRLKGCWENFKKAVAEKALGDPTTTDTRERWLFPLFQELGFGRLTVAKPIEVDGHSYPVSHGWNQVPIHLVGSHADLDHRTPGAIGASKASPHSLVQSALNSSDAHLWGIVSNGFNLRLLRDNIALTRLAFVEFDLQAMFDGDLYSEFFVLWLVCHQSRFEGEKTDQYWLERWKKFAEDKTLRALDDLYPGVKKAIAVLGAGLVSNRANRVLLEKLRSGRLSTQEFYKQVLRVIYRLLFLLVAEDRDLLHLVDVTEAGIKARHRYREFYSITRLRALTLYRAGTPHPDLWQVFQLVTTKLGSDTGCPEIALPSLGSFLWTAAQSTPDLLDSLISNRHFLEAVHALAFVQNASVRRAVDYKNLGSEELGSVYQGLLEMHPRINADAGSFELDIAAGNERKTSGSYYTPDPLVQCLLDSALEPVIAERLAKAKTPKEKETALLSLKVCDMAAGSGHFIIRAGHRIARHLARVRSGEEEPCPAVHSTALRDVIGHCLYGVDINPMAVELCKVTLWLEAIEPGKPLSFLDHHIRCGNSLLGTTAELISAGLPDDTFKPIEGDDPEASSSLKKLNKAQREGLRHLFIAEDTAIRERMHKAAAAIDEISDSRPDDIHRKEAAFRNAQQNYDFQKAWDLANLWCAAFVIKKHFPGGACVPASLEASTPNPPPSTIQSSLFGGTEKAPEGKAKKAKAPGRAGSETPIGITTQHLRDFVEGGALPDGLQVEAKRLADQYQFFHFHLAFPEVFAQGGFDVGLGNPPWERLKIEDQEWFSSLRPGIALEANGNERQKLIDELKISDPQLHALFLEAVREAEGKSHFLRNSGAFPLCGRGDVNTYSVFTELSWRLIGSKGRSGLVVITGIATDDTTKEFFRALIREGRICSLYAFWEVRRFFPGTDSRNSFGLLTLSGARLKDDPVFVFHARSLAELKDENRRVQLNATDVALLNPYTGTCPVFTNRQDAELNKRIYRTIPLLAVKTGTHEIELEWGAFYMRLVDLGDHKDDIRDRDTPSDSSWNVPLYESKIVGQFDHRFATFDSSVTFEERQKGQPRLISESEKRHPDLVAQPRYFVRNSLVAELNAKYPEFDRAWLLVWRDVSNVGSERTSISAIVPRHIASRTCPGLGITKSKVGWLLAGLLNSFVFDYLARQKVSGLHFNWTLVSQLPTPPPSSVSKSWMEFIQPRVLELTYTAWDLEAFAKDCGWPGPPFRWDEERRFLLRCELDAAFFHLYLGPETDWIKQSEGLTKAFPTPRHAVDYILDTFPIVKRKDGAKFNGDYRTKRVILEIYDTLAESIQSGRAYQTRLNPAPASLAVAHAWGWEDKPLELPTVPRTRLPENWQYVVNVILELLWQAGGSLPWPLLRSATDLLSDRRRVAKPAEPLLGKVVRDWLALDGDNFDAEHRWDQLSGFCHAGKMRVIRRSGELIVELLSVEGHVFFPHVRFDARLALTVARTFPATPAIQVEATEDRRVAELITA